MAKFYQLKISDITKETEDTVSIAFDLGDLDPDVFQYIPGQYLTLKKDIEGEDVRRSYSICSSAYVGESLRIAVKKVYAGKFSTFANEDLKVGDEIEVMPPMGNFHTKIEEGNKKKYVAFAAGSGITPVISIMKSVLAVEEESSFVLFYGNKSAQSIIFKEEIEDLKNKYITRLEVYHVLSREDPGVDIFRGRIDRDKCQKFIHSFPNLLEGDEYFLCGPEEMIHSVKEELKSQNVDDKKVHFELFTSPTSQLGKRNQVVSKEPQETFNSVVRIIMDGDETEIGVNSDGKPILDEALEQGVDAPFACKGAVCCTCKAKVIEGKVRMDMNYALEEDEVEAGYILTCQAHPESKHVVVDFDS